MRFLRLSPRSRKWLVFLGVLRFVFEALDWIVGKIGYLGVFTSPEDFRVMLERAPSWLAAVLDAVQPAFVTLWSWFRVAWGAASGEAGTLVVLAAIVLLLIVDAERLAQLRRSLWFKARQAVSDQVWISKQSAMKVMADSDWGKLRLPHVTEKHNPWESIVLSLGQQERTVYGLSPREKAQRKHAMFLRRTLDSFAEHNPTAVRTHDDSTQYEQGALLKFLDFALDDELESEFGRVPSYRVTD